MKIKGLIKKKQHTIYTKNKIKYIDFKINRICYDSRKVNSGDIFIAIEGINLDGHDFIKNAIHNGASIIIHQKDIQQFGKIILIQVNNSRKYLAKLSYLNNNHESQDLNIIGLTGTNGKTTTSYIIEKIFKKAGYNSGVIGTINYRFESFKKENRLTTPESYKLQNIIAKMVKSKVTHLIIEISSHSIKMNRILYLNFDIGVFTNLTQDHLDYHHSMKKYWQTKKKLFTKYLKKNGSAIINIDNKNGEKLNKILFNNKKIITIGISKKSNIRPISFSFSHSGTTGIIMTPKGKFKLNSHLIGLFNLKNILSAIGVAIASKISLKKIKNGINDVLKIPGRLEKINDKRHIYIDYAHTPNALEKVLKTINSIKKKKSRVITIFGCGGNRDISKRIKMGKISGLLSDLTIITSDNPRFEDQSKIFNQIRIGISKSKTKYVRYKKLDKHWFEKIYTIIFDRRKAIATGISLIKKQDMLVITGKGHEKYQIINGKTLNFNDKDEVLRNI